MLFRWGNVTFRAICQGDVHREGKGAAGLEFQSGQAKNLVGDSGDAEVTDAQRLQLEFRGGTLMEVNGFQRVDVSLGLRQLIAEGLLLFLGPSQAGFIRDAVIQGQGSLHHRQRHGGVPFDLAVGRCDPLSDFPGVSVVFQRRFGRGTVVATPEVATGALTHDRGETGASLQQLADMHGETPEVV